MLEKIFEAKEREIAALRQRKRFKEALLQPHTAVIAEIKRRSPSKGEISAIEDPIALAQAYIEGGAAAISVLTDKEGFGGSLDDLRAIAARFPNFPLLRKDFILDELQIEESARAGASAILLIVKFLGEKTGQFLRKAHALGLDALVEVHNEEELQIAIAAGAEIIGINNRDLTTFEVDMETCTRLAPLIPKHIVKVAESGLSSHLPGFDAVLVGETLVKATDKKALIEELAHATH